MAKVNVKQVVIEKGERYAFFGAGGLMLLFMIIGLMEMSDSPDTEKFVGEVDQNSQRIKSAMNSPDAKAPDLPSHVTKNVTFPSVRMSELTAFHFDPIAPPDTRRTNPTVKQVAEIEAKFMWAKIPALDIRDINGKPHIGVMFVKAAKTENIDKERQGQFIKDLDKRLNRPKRSQPNFGMGMGQFGIMGGPGGPGPGGFQGGMGERGGHAGFGPGGPGSGPGPGGPGSGPGPGGPGAGPGPGGPGGPGSGMMGGRFGIAGGEGGGFDGRAGGFGHMPGPMGGMGGSEIEIGERLGVEYIPLDPEKIADKRLALTIYPQRMVIIHAAFPYKEQVKEFARALRFKDEAEIFDPRNDAAPIFKGFLIQRRVLYLDQRVAADWHDLNYESHYRETIYPRSLGDHEDPWELSYVKLPVEADMVMPLPDLSGMKGTYPEITLESIQKTIQKGKDLNKPPAIPKSLSKQKGEGSIFGNNKLSQEAFGTNQPTSPEMTLPKGGRKGTGMSPEGMGMGTNPATVAVAELPDAVLMRLIDNDIIPGRLYQYRMKVLMQNPNWAGPQDDKGNWTVKDKFELVSHRQDAKRMLLGASEEDARAIEQRFFGDIKDEKARLEEVRWNTDKKDAATPWQEMKGFVRVPQEDFFFAIDPSVPMPDPNDPKKTVGVKLEPGQGLLQVQRWLPTANIKGYREPVADWVVADVVARRGYYLGGEQFVNLPIWSSEFNRYVLRKVPADKDAKHKEGRRGVVMDPTKPGPRYAVVDIEGGTIRKRFTRQIDDESATEILLVDEDGRLYVRSSARDRSSLNRYMKDPNGPYVVHNGGVVTRYQQGAKYGADAERVLDREEVWNKWVEETDKASRVFDPESAGGVNPMKGKFD
jgi:hypothetical protein